MIAIYRAKNFFVLKLKIKVIGNNIYVYTHIDRYYILVVF